MPISVLVTANGDPQPPEDVLRRLRAVDGGLTLEWQRQMKQWTVKRAWPQSDRRWQWVQEQSYPPSAAHDILGYVPNDCDVDQVPAYVEGLIRTWPVEDAKQLLERMVHYNDRTDAVAAVVEQAVEETLETAVETVLKRKPGRPKKVTSETGA